MLNIWSLLCLLWIFEAQEDQTEMSQQAAASDEEEETPKKVWTADKMSVGLQAAVWAVSISYSYYVTAGIKPWSADWVRRFASVGNCETSHKDGVILLWILRGPHRTSHVTHHTPQCVIAHTETAPGPLTANILVTEVRGTIWETQISSSNFQSCC